MTNLRRNSKSISAVTKSELTVFSTKLINDMYEYIYDWENKGSKSEKMNLSGKNREVYNAVKSDRLSLQLVNGCLLSNNDIPISTFQNQIAKYYTNAMRYGLKLNESVSYIIQRGEELGISCHDSLVRLFPCVIGR